MRTFIALELSNEVKNELSRLQTELKKTGAEIKWVNPENIHLTIKFLGNIASDKIERIKKILDETSSRSAPFKISLFRLGAFPSLDRPRVIWAGIDRGCAEVEKIAGIMEEKFGVAGFEKNDRPFSAHLTLGRVRSGKNIPGLKKAISAVEVRPGSCLIKHIGFFQSTLTPRGSIYTPLHAAELSGAPS